MEKSFKEMVRSTKKEETRVITQQRYTKLHHTVPISLFHLFIGNVSDKDIGMVLCSFVHLFCVMTLVSSFLVFQDISISPFILNK